jgi:hypothetical protein
MDARFLDSVESVLLEGVAESSGGVCGCSEFEFVADVDELEAEEAEEEEEEEEEVDEEEVEFEEGVERRWSEDASVARSGRFKMERTPGVLRITSSRMFTLWCGSSSYSSSEVGDGVCAAELSGAALCSAVETFTEIKSPDGGGDKSGRGDKRDTASAP